MADDILKLVVSVMKNTTHLLFIQHAGVRALGRIMFALPGTTPVYMGSLMVIVYAIDSSCATRA